MSIANIFEFEGEQVVVLKTNDPAIDIHFEVVEEGMITLTMNFTDDDEGFENRDRAFDTLDEEAISGIRESVFADLDDVEPDGGETLATERDGFHVDGAVDETGHRAQ